MTFITQDEYKMSAWQWAVSEPKHTRDHEGHALVEKESRYQNAPHIELLKGTRDL